MTDKTTLVAQLAQARRDGWIEARDEIIAYLQGVAERCQQVGRSETYSSRGEYIERLIDPYIRTMQPPGETADD